MNSSSECAPMREIQTLCASTLADRQSHIIQASDFLDRECWEMELILASIKWFDYRFMSPVEATQQFVSDYVMIFRRKWSTTFETASTSQKLAVAKTGLFHSRREFSTFWNARAHADLLGVPYPLYVSAAMDKALRRGKWKRLPRPGQLREADSVRAVEERWKEELSGGRCISELPHFRSENFVGLPQQSAHQEHAAQVARKRSNIRMALGHFIDCSRVVPVAVAERVYDEDLVNSAREAFAGRSSPVPQMLVPDEQLIPSCFGLPIKGELPDECEMCPLRLQCRQQSSVCMRDVVALHGTVDPCDAHRKQVSRDRQQRYRDRRKAKILEAPDRIASESVGVPDALSA